MKSYVFSFKKIFFSFYIFSLKTGLLLNVDFIANYISNLLPFIKKDIYLISSKSLLCPHIIGSVSHKGVTVS